MTTTLKDLEIGVSECCGAKVYEGGRCSECKEMGGVEEETEK